MPLIGKLHRSIIWFDNFVTIRLNKCRWKAKKNNKLKRIRTLFRVLMAKQSISVPVPSNPVRRFSVSLTVNQVNFWLSSSAARQLKRHWTHLPPRYERFYHADTLPPIPLQMGHNTLLSFICFPFSNGILLRSIHDGLDRCRLKFQSFKVLINWGKLFIRLSYQGYYHTYTNLPYIHVFVHPWIIVLAGYNYNLLFQQTIIANYRYAIYI